MRAGRRVLLRDGMNCRNPGCGRKLGLQAQRLVFRSKEGKTALSNEVAVCAQCHAAIHFGLLKAEGDPLKGLRWFPAGDAIRADIEPEREELVELPVCAVPVDAAGGPEGVGALPPGFCT